MNCVYGKKIYTGKSVAEDRYLVFSGQRISGLSKTPESALLGKYPVITPAFIDAHSHIGMSRAGEPNREAESNDHLDSVFPLPDALDSVQMDDGAFKDAVEMGVLYSCVLPGSGNILGGQLVTKGTNIWPRNHTERHGMLEPIKIALVFFRVLPCGSVAIRCLRKHDPLSKRIPV